ncbi:MAG: hypothetical protein Q8L40_05400 [Burkholderiales bacterium]|nr:hypothetical protein [Burkholderiales bacterium]
MFTVHDFSSFDIVWERGALPRMSLATLRRMGALTPLYEAAKNARRFKTGISRQGRQERQEEQKRGHEGLLLIRGCDF